MKNFLLVFMILPGILIAQTKKVVQFIVDGKMRETIIVIPSTAPPGGGYPVVFMLHGTSGDGEKFYNISGWKELGEQKNFITVFPSSLTWCFVEDGIEKNLTRWVNGTVVDNPCSGPPQNYVDDVKFLKLVAQRIIDSLPANPKKIFACGFSNGCSMIHKLAVEAGDVFAAVAGTSSILSPSDSAAPIKAIPIWTAIGTLDDRFLTPPWTELPFGEDSILVYLKTPIQRVLGSQGLTNDFIKKETAISHTYTFKTSNGTSTSKPYIFSLLKGMTHEFPNGTNYPVSGPEIFWEFFNQAVSVSVPEAVPTFSAFQVYPNPVSSTLNIQGKFISQESITMSIRNILGQVIYQNKLYPPLETWTKEIDMDAVPAGNYYLSIQTKEGMYTYPVEKF